MNFTKKVGTRSNSMNIKSLPHLEMSLEKEATKTSKYALLIAYSAP